MAMNELAPEPSYAVRPAPADFTIFTIGHSTRTIPEFVALLSQVEVALLIDIRSIPSSRAAPQFNGDTLGDTLAGYDIGYRHLPALGGRRHRRRGAPPSSNGLWRVDAFRNYADYAETAPFREGLQALEARARERRCAIMCAEAVWWRCHRRIVADYLLADGVPVRHIMGLGKVVPATLTPGAQEMPNGTVHYPGAATP